MKLDILGDQLRFGHTDEQTALVVDDYPYGYKLRCQIRYWLETTKNGDRFCSQTLNPKTDKWNKPKKSTYAEVGVIYVDADDHVQWAGVSTWADDDYLTRFMELTGDHLSQPQRNKLARVLGVRKAFEGVTYNVRNSTQDTAEQKAAADVEHKAAMEVLAKRAAIGTFQAKQALAAEFGAVG